ncbi:MAG: tetratricopeptide repeat protein [Candidatus ainarchaeum sp.]|nr:tetratricopeptide repeat protein [Candidatus ainarchaeum sp.]
MHYQPLARAAGRALVAGLAFGAMAPAIDGISTVAAQVRDSGYSMRTDPFLADAAITDIANAMMRTAKDTRGRMAALHSLLKASSQSGIRVVPSTDRHPNTAAETLDKGGDCTEFAYVVLAVINAMNTMGAGIQADASVVHFRDSPPDKDHMIVSVMMKGKRTVIDLQSDAFGKTAKGQYDVLLRFTPEMAAAVYHREYGDYLRDAGNPSVAMLAYLRAAEIFDGDAYVQQNLGILYEKIGRPEAAREYFERANELAPGRYAKDVARGDYNTELKLGEDAYNNGDWAGGKEHFTNALRLGTRLKHGDSAVINEYITDCEARLK